MNLNPVGWPNQTSLRQPLPVVGWNAPASYTGNLLDLQVGGASRLRVTTGDTGYSGASNRFAIYSTLVSIRDFYGAAFIANGDGVNNGLKIGQNTSGFLDISGSNLGVGLNFPNGVVYLSTDSHNILAQRSGTSAQTLRVYNTYTSSTNYERAKLEWSSNVLNVGTEKGSGGGTARSMALQTDATDRLALDTTGSVRVVTALTVATLPASPTVGMIARVTNALSPTVGSTVAGGGSANALCWYNGTNWTVLGI